MNHQDLQLKETGKLSNWTRFSVKHQSLHYYWNIGIITNIVLHSHKWSLDPTVFNKHELCVFVGGEPTGTESRGLQSHWELAVVGLGQPTAQWRWTLARDTAAQPRGGLQWNRERVFSCKGHRSHPCPSREKLLPEPECQTFEFYCGERLEGSHLSRVPGGRQRFWFIY